MWFNILKIEGRRAAYRLFVNSMVHLGELIPPKTPTEVLNEGGIRLLAFETSNGHFEWEVEYLKNGSMGKIYLASAPNDIEPYIDYIEGMFEQEYPDQYAALQEFFKENSPRSQEKNQLEELEQDINFIEEHGLPKKIIRKVIHDFSHFKITLANNVRDSLLESEYTFHTGATRAEVRTLHNQLDRNIEFRYKDILSTFLVNIEDKNLLYGDGSIFTKIELLLRIIAFSYRDQIRRNNPNLVWEHFVNFATFFREDYLNLIHSSTRLTPDTEYPELPILQRIMQVQLNEIYSITQQRWDNETNTQTLIRNIRF